MDFLIGDQVDEMPIPYFGFFIGRIALLDLKNSSDVFFTFRIPDLKRLEVEPEERMGEKTCTLLADQKKQPFL